MHIKVCMVKVKENNKRNYNIIVEDEYSETNLLFGLSITLVIKFQSNYNDWLKAICVTKREYIKIL